MNRPKLDYARKWVYEQKTCLVCRGSGWFALVPIMIPCEECNGDGFITTRSAVKKNAK